MAITWTYCEPDDVKAYIGSIAADAFTAHDARGTNTAILDCIQQATDEMNLFLLRRYSETALRSVRMLKRWCVVWSACFVFERRGNPVPDRMVAEFQRIEKALNEIATGKLFMPGIPQASPTVPSLSNMVIDRRYPRSQPRVVTQNSSNWPLSRNRKVEGAWNDI
jgi:hypothetical protein